MRERIVGATLATAIAISGCGALKKETGSFSCEPSVAAAGALDNKKPMAERVGWFAGVIKACYDRAPKKDKLPGIEGIFAVRIHAQNGAEVLFTNHAKDGVTAISDKLEDLKAVSATIFPHGGTTKVDQHQPAMHIDLVSFTEGWGTNWQDETARQPQRYAVNPDGLISASPGGENHGRRLGQSVRDQILGQFSMLLSDVVSGQPIPPTPPPQLK